MGGFTVSAFCAKYPDKNLTGVITSGALTCMEGNQFATLPEMDPHTQLPNQLGDGVCSVQEVRDWYVTKTNLMQPGDPERRVVVTAETMVVEGPDDAVTTYPLSELKAVALDEDGALAKFGGKRYVYIPARALSDTRYAALVKMLRSRK